MLNSGGHSSLLSVLVFGCDVWLASSVFLCLDFLVFRLWDFWRMAINSKPWFEWSYMFLGANCHLLTLSNQPLEWENCLYSVNHILNKQTDWPGRKYRWVNQTGSRGRAMSTGEGPEGRSSFFIPAQNKEKQIVTCPTGKIPDPHG